MNRNLVQLNKKVAKELVKKVLGVSGSGLTKDKTGDGADIPHGYGRTEYHGRK